MLSEFASKGFKELIVYNYNVSPSNEYYRELGGEVKKQTYQMNGKLLVDIFSFDVENLKGILEKIILDRYNT